MWHRLYAEASIPPGAGFVVWLAATDEAQPPAADATAAWHPHGFGRDIAALAAAAMGPHVPRAAWERAPSELPNHPGLAPWTPERERRGLFRRPDPERHRARAAPRRPLPVGAGRAVRRRPQRAGHRGPSCVCEPLRLCRALPGAALSRSRARRGRGIPRRAGRSDRPGARRRTGRRRQLHPPRSPRSSRPREPDLDAALRSRRAGRPPLAADGSGGRVGMAAGPRNDPRGRPRTGIDRDLPAAGHARRISSRASSRTSKAC